MKLIFRFKKQKSKDNLILQFIKRLKKTKKLRDESDKKLEQKSNEILNLKNAIETLKSKHQE